MSVNDRGNEVLKKSARQKFGDTGAADGLTQKDVGFEYVLSTENDDTRYTLVDAFSSSITYEGKTFDNDSPNEASSIWQIKRTEIALNLTTVKYANQGKYDQIWDDRQTIFGDIGLTTNQFSTLFDGVDESMTTDSPGVSGTAAKTLSAWLKVSGTGNMNVLSYGSDTTSNLISFIVIDSAERVIIDIKSAFRRFTATNLFNGDWHHVAITMPAGGDINGTKAYMDGAPLSVDSTTNNSYNTGTNVNVVVGARIGNTNFFAGNIDEVSIWNVELTATEVVEIYNSGTPADLLSHSKAASLFNWWRMGENSSFPTIPDNSVRQEDGVLINMESDDIVSDVPS